MPATNIILPEHNSSRLLFIDNQDPNFNLTIENLEQDSSEKDKCNCSDPKFLLGQLNDYIWLLEDSGTYDTNHTHQANLNYLHLGVLIKYLLELKLLGLQPHLDLNFF